MDKFLIKTPVASKERIVIHDDDENTPNVSANASPAKVSKRTKKDDDSDFEADEQNEESEDFVVDDDEDESFGESAANAKASKSGAKRKRGKSASSAVAAGAKPKKLSKKAANRASTGNTWEQERRAMGDHVKRAISFEKWTIAADTHTRFKVPFDVFEKLIGPNARKVTPEEYSADDEVIVCHLDRVGAGEAFGKSKLTGGSRMATFNWREGVVIYYPKSSVADVYWTMSGY